MLTSTSPDEIYARFVSVIESLTESSPSAFAFPAFVKPSIYKGKVTWRQCVVVRFWHPDENSSEGPSPSPDSSMQASAPDVLPRGHANGSLSYVSTCGSGRDIRERMQLRGFALFPEAIEWRRAVEPVAMRKMKRMRKMKKTGTDAPNNDGSRREGSVESCSGDPQVIEKCQEIGLENIKTASSLDNTNGDCDHTAFQPRDTDVDGPRYDRGIDMNGPRCDLVTDVDGQRMLQQPSLSPTPPLSSTSILPSTNPNEEVEAAVPANVTDPSISAQLMQEQGVPEPSSCAVGPQFWASFARNQISQTPPLFQPNVSKKVFLTILLGNNNKPEVKKVSDGKKRKKCGSIDDIEEEEERLLLSHGFPTESSIQSYEARMREAGLGSEASGETLTKLAMACGCNGHWDNLAYWTFNGPYHRFPRLREMTPESIVRHYLGSVDEFRSLWTGCELKDDPLIGGPREISTSSPPLLPLASHLSFNQEGPLLDMSRVGAIAALGHLGSVLSRQGVAMVGPAGEEDLSASSSLTVIPPLEEYVRLAESNRQLGPEQRRPMVKYMLYRSLRKVPKAYPFPLRISPRPALPRPPPALPLPLLPLPFPSSSHPNVGAPIDTLPLPLNQRVDCPVSRTGIVKPEWAVRQYISHLLTSKEDLSHLRSLLYLGSKAYDCMRKEFAISKGTPFVTTAEVLQFVKSDPVVVILARSYGIYLVGEGEGSQEDHEDQEEEADDEKCRNKVKVKKGGINLGFKQNKQPQRRTSEGYDDKKMDSISPDSYEIDWSSVQWSVDHIVPRSMHGLDHPSNYCLMPTRVNSAFGAKWVTFDLSGEGGGGGRGLKEEVVGAEAYRDAMRFHQQWMSALMPDKATAWSEEPPPQPPQPASDPDPDPPVMLQATSTEQMIEEAAAADDSAQENPFVRFKR